jgi:hypothetical protein
MRVAAQVPSLDGATGWINSGPISAASLRRRVVLVNFGTYTCINWLRSLPYIRAWDRRYRDQGLVIIGVQTPEFAFEHNIYNVRRAVMDMNIDYPVAIDNGYAIWHEFDNHYWPATYLFDARGSLRHYHFGEGGYEQSEAVIRQLLDETGAETAGSEPALVEATGVEAPADWDNLESTEVYLGYARGEHFVSGGLGAGVRQRYSTPWQLQLNHWALAGEWVMTEQSIGLEVAGGRISYRFHARDVNLVMGPMALGRAVRYMVLIDGRPPGDSHGEDTDEAGWGTVRDQRLYQLVRQRGPIADRLVEIEFLGAGVEALAFTFG